MKFEKIGKYGKWQETIMPKEPFLYFSARCFLPSSLTEEVGDRLSEKWGEELDVAFSEDKHLKAKIVEVDKIPIATGYYPFDWVYRFFFEVVEYGYQLEEVAKYKDEHIDYKKAWEKHSALW